MTKEEWKDLWEQEAPRVGPFPRDLAAMEFINELSRENKNIIHSAMSCRIWFSTDCGVLRSFVSGNDVDKLRGFGVQWSANADALFMDV